MFPITALQEDNDISNLFEIRFQYNLQDRMSSDVHKISTVVLLS